MLRHHVTEQVFLSCNYSDLGSGGHWLESRLGHRLPRLRFIDMFFYLPRPMPV
jgi:hypothetical protein